MTPNPYLQHYATLQAERATAVADFKAAERAFRAVLADINAEIHVVLETLRAEFPVEFEAVFREESQAAYLTGPEAPRCLLP